jgi:hypothetical protein
MLARNLTDHMLRTYAALRRVLAVVTILFLLALAGYRLAVHFHAFADPMPRNSVSAYYYHDNTGLPMRDLFVGVLCGVGVLLIAYQGYSKLENWLLNSAGAFIILVVFFPMDWPPSGESEVADLPPHTLHAKVHYTCAVGFFLCLALVCWFCAADTLAFVRDETRRARYRNCYRAIGACMAAVPPLAIGLALAKRPDAVYIVECAGVLVFWLYWLAKSGELRTSQLETPAHIREAAAIAGQSQPLT